ncbi:hypothetical protein J7643_16765 [bacterium]|nr:hypothetical protein [bacterium]
MIRVFTLFALVALLAAGCQKAEPRSTASDPYQAQRLRTLTHDTDLAGDRKAPGDLSSLQLHLSREASEALIP